MGRPTLKRRVAVLFDAVEDDYQYEIVRAVVEESRSLNVALRCLAGGVIGAEGQQRNQARNFLFESFDPDTVDGLLLLSGSLGNHVGSERFAAWVERFAGKPQVHLGVPVAGRDSIAIEGGTAQRELVEHIIAQHGRSKIAFVSGPATSQESEERLAAYRVALANAGIPFDPALVVEGTWLRESGEDAVRELLDRRGISLRGDGALVAANDYMALGALDALRARELTVPTDVLVVGFDDIPAARSTEPPLTTIRQPTDRLGREGLRRLVSAMNNPGEPLATVWPAELIVRGSCGCRVQQPQPVVVRARGADTQGLYGRLMDRRALLTAELARAARGNLHGVGAGWEERLVSALLVDLTQPGAAELAVAVEKLVERLPPGTADLGVLHGLLDVLREALRASGGGDPQAVIRGQDALDHARKVVGDCLVRAHTHKSSETVRQLREITRLAAALQDPVTFEGQRAHWGERLRGLGIESFVLGVFAVPGQPEERCVPLLAYRAEEAGELPADFVTGQFGPDGWFDDEGALLVQPVFFGSQVLGLVSFPWGPLAGPVYEQVRELLGIGLRGRALALGRS